MACPIDFRSNDELCAIFTPLALLTYVIYSQKLPVQYEFGFMYLGTQKLYCFSSSIQTIHND